MHLEHCVADSQEKMNGQKMMVDGQERRRWMFRGEYIKKDFLQYAPSLLADNVP